MELKLSQGKIAVVDDEDFDLISSYKFKLRESKSSGFYVDCYFRDSNNKRKYVPMHRIIMEAEKEQNVDHKNGNGLDNRRENLRFCTDSQNAMNRTRIVGKSSYKGIYWNTASKGWYSRIYVNKKRINLGTYKDEVEAAKAYDKAAIKHFGEFAKTNFKDKNGDDSS
jgi:hypothetical protein